MKSRIGALTALVFTLACTTAAAAPATVQLRVEGAKATIFEGKVTTDGHKIEQDKNGPQSCDGTNGGANPAAGPTITSALDDALNGTPAQAGGCQVQVKNGDEVLWAYDMFSAKQILRLTGPKTAKIGTPFKVKVVDTLNGNKAVKGADVAGVKTNAKGVASLSYSDKGVLDLKAEAKNAVRSNTLVVRVR
jgi:hypothetical protein